MTAINGRFQRKDILQLPLVVVVLLVLLFQRLQTLLLAALQVEARLARVVVTSSERTATRDLVT